VLTLLIWAIREPREPREPRIDPDAPGLGERLGGSSID
jgi:hypothetical protein